MANRHNAYTDTRSASDADDDIKTPLSDRVEKMDTGLGKEFLKMPAFYGDITYNAGRAIKKKFE